MPKAISADPGPTLREADQAKKAAGSLTDPQLDSAISSQAGKLSQCLVEISDLQEALDFRRGRSVTRAWIVGTLLNERRARTQHGDWLPYLASVNISQQAASQYCRIAQVDDPGKLPGTIERTIAALPQLLGKPQKTRDSEVLNHAELDGSEPSNSSEIKTPPPVYVPPPNIDYPPVASDASRITMAGPPDLPDTPEFASAGFSDVKLQARVEELEEENERLQERISILEADTSDEIMAAVNRVLKERDAARSQVDELQAKVRTQHAQIAVQRRELKSYAEEAQTS